MSIQEQRPDQELIAQGRRIVKWYVAKVLYAKLDTITDGYEIQMSASQLEDLASRIEERYGIAVPMKEMDRFCTILDLMQYLEQRPDWKSAVQRDAPAKVDREGSDHDYVKMCLKPQYSEVAETRNAGSSADFHDVLDMLQRLEHMGIVAETKKLATKYDDLDLVYWWQANALLCTNQVRAAREVAQLGLGKSRRKFNLLACQGEIELVSTRGRTGGRGLREGMTEALYSWAQAVHCQEGLDGYGGSHDAYLYLSYVAEVLGLSDVASAFRLRVDTINPGWPRLAPERALELRNAAKALIGSAAAEKILHTLAKKYIARKHAGMLGPIRAAMRRLRVIQRH